jgi:hypothetical protein
MARRVGHSWERQRHGWGGIRVSRLVASQAAATLLKLDKIIRVLVYL